MGSIARDIIRQSHCNVLLIMKPNHHPKPFSKVVLNMVEGEAAARYFDQSMEFVRKEKLERLYITRECDLHGFKRMMNEDLTETEALQLNKEMIQEDKSVFQYAESKLKNVPFVTKMLSGKPGVEISNFTKEIEADLLIICAPGKKYNLIDRIFPHDLEHILADLPANILMVKS